MSEEAQDQRIKELEAERDGAHRAADWNMQVVAERDARIADLEAALRRIATHPDARDSVASIAYGELAGGEAGGEEPPKLPSENWLPLRDKLIDEGHL